MLWEPSEVALAHVEVVDAGEESLWDRFQELTEAGGGRLAKLGKTAVAGLGELAERSRDSLARLRRGDDVVQPGTDGDPADVEVALDGPTAVAFGRLLEAVAFAAEKHRHQRRKDEAASPYINHPIDVALLVAREAGVTDLDVLQAAILHDTIEDTETTPEELEEQFGARVRQLVEEVTDDKDVPKAERKRLQIEHADGLSDGAKLIKIADKICNVTDVINRPPVGWSTERRREYLDWTEGVVRGCRGAAPRLEDLYDARSDEGRRNVADS